MIETQQLPATTWHQPAVGNCVRHEGRATEGTASMPRRFLGVAALLPIIEYTPYTRLQSTRG